jgi:hypothetical protein
MVIKFKLVKFEKAVAFQVLEQVPEAGEFGEFAAANGMSVSVRHAPELGDSGVFLRGEYVEEDLMIATRYFDTNEERDEYYQKVVDVLRFWARHVSKPKPEATEPDVFEF